MKNLKSLLIVALICNTLCSQNKKTTDSELRDKIEVVKVVQSAPIL